MKSFKPSHLLILISLSLIGLWNGSFAQTQLEAQLSMGTNNLRALGFELVNFTPGSSEGTISFLRTSSLVENGEYYIRTPYFYLNAEEDANSLTVAFNSELTNNSVQGAVVSVKLLDVFESEIASNSVNNASPTATDFIFPLNPTSQGFYKIEIRVRPNRTGNSSAQWRISNLSLSGPIQGSWQKEAWVVRENTVAKLIAENAPDEENIVFIGDDVEFNFSSTFQTSSNDIILSTGRFDIVYPERVKINRIDLMINGEAVLYTNDLENWNNGERACGCPQTFELPGGEFFNRMTVLNIENNDIIQIKVNARASEKGDFRMSLRFDGGKAIPKPVQEVQNAFTSMSVGNNNFISFSTQDEISVNIEGDQEETEITGSIIPFSTQPVELVYFRANISQTNPILEWATAVEINNDFFTIERSSNGRDFYEVGRVDGKGDFVGTIEYSFTDRASRQGTWFYRLVQTDFDGTSKTYEAIRAVVQSELKPELKVLKSPSDRNQLVFMLNGVESQEFQASIVDMNGKVINSIALSSLPTDGQMITMDGLSLNKGIYILNVHNNRERLVQRVMVD